MNILPGQTYGLYLCIPVYSLCMKGREPHLVLSKVL